MKLQIKHASPVLNKHSDFKWSVTHWSVIGTYLMDDNGCMCNAKTFDTYIPYTKLDGNKQEIYQLTKNKLEENGETV